MTHTEGKQPMSDDTPFIPIEVTDDVLLPETGDIDPADADQLGDWTHADEEDGDA